MIPIKCCPSSRCVDPCGPARWRQAAVGPGRRSSGHREIVVLGAVDDGCAPLFWSDGDMSRVPTIHKKTDMYVCVVSPELSGRDDRMVCCPPPPGGWHSPWQLGTPWNDGAPMPQMVEDMPEKLWIPARAHRALPVDQKFCSCIIGRCMTSKSVTAHMPNLNSGDVIEPAGHTHTHTECQKHSLCWTVVVRPSPGNGFYAPGARTKPSVVCALCAIHKNHAICVRLHRKGAARHHGQQPGWLPCQRLCVGVPEPITSRFAFAAALGFRENNKSTTV